MKVRDRKNGLNEALAFFETCLETPVIPGELPQWCDNATTACSALKAELAQETGQTHPKMFSQIREEDPALASRIDTMRENDEQLHEQAEQVATYLHHLRELSGEVEPDEAKVEEQVEKAAKKGISLVFEIRKQETAITTWYMEALERDRGVVD